MLVPILPHWLKGKPPAQFLEDYCALQHTRYQKTYHQRASLGVVRIGENPASLVYIQHKRVMAEKIGFSFREHIFSADTPPSAVLELLAQWNADPHLHGILLQLPVPAPHRADTYLSCISPEKDVDGLNPKSPKNQPFIPCTPLGCLILLTYYKVPLSGSHSVIIGRSKLVGLPLARLLLRHNSTVTVTHRHTTNLSNLTRQADILCVCAGQPWLIQEEDISSHTIILDIGIHRRKDGSLVGDVHPLAQKKAKAVTPVPGGIGPMTVRGLMWNTLRAAFRGQGEDLHLTDLLHILGTPL